MSRKKPAHLTHLDGEGNARMVDVGDKKVTAREATASGRLTMEPETMAAIRSGETPKGDVLAVARIAAIQAAKETSRWIPLCHPLPLDAVEVCFDFLDDSTVAVTTVVRTTARTGVEMEALTAAAAALLTVYDMCKALDRSMVLGPIQLEEKRGGQSGHWRRSKGT
ncbi:MAG: cyclic pyranopterin monophosphate synthase MoaC [Planctomycetota bacterium]